ncbi:MAG: excinuclease ABC subunit UvrA [Sedimentibacter sp.]
MDKIVIRGAKENNLKNINVELPRDKLIVFTGVSGSGKTSLAFDTIYAEGQRRYVESLSSYARQFLGQMEKPNVESIEGLSPAISIDQKTTNRNPRSTVGTVTEIYDYFRLLFARVGIPHCPNCGKPITTQTIDQITDKVLEYEEKNKIQILAPMARGAKGTHKKLLEEIKKDGFVRVRVDGELYDLEDDIVLDKNKKHNIEVVIDRLIIKEGIQKRLVDSIETALELSGGMVLIDAIGKEEHLLSTKFACTDCGIGFGEIAPRMFSFNNPFGMCKTCSGLGVKKEIDIDLVIPDYSKTIAERAIAPFGSEEEGYYYQIFKAIADYHDFDITKPLSEAPKEFIDEILYGTNGRNVTVDFVSKFQGPKVYTRDFEGVINNLQRRYMETKSPEMREWIEEYMDESPCPDCHGARLNPVSLAVKVGNKNIYEVTKLSVVKSLKFFKELKLSPQNTVIGGQIIKEINSRLQFLSDVGLNYLTLERNASTLSGGESQRIRLATQIGSSLVGVLYVLDEPSIGLHQRDNSMLIKTLRNLTDLGNTLIVVEHDEETMENADYILDIGPGAGIHGGEVVAYGTFEDIKNNENSITGQYLSGKKKIEVPDVRRKTDKFIEIKGARENNLKNIDIKIPLGLMCCVTGVSGSGKSSLINEILSKSLHQKLFKNRNRSGEYDEILGIEQVDKIITIDQSPIGRTPRSNPATYTGVFDYIRDVFSMTMEAKERGYKKGRFSFNVKGGRCEACHGDGILKIEMHFLPDVYVPCEVCKGKRYNRETLEVKYKGKSISEVLDMTIDEAVEFFENIPKIYNKIKTMQDVGLGYVKLGQPSTELSGGEAQRIKLAFELSRRGGTGNTLYVLDEPTTGLHIADIHMLIEVLDRLVEVGNSVIVIEHNLDVIKTADYIIDLGPEGGDGGGTIVAQGTPEEVAKVKASYTGQYLKKMLK